MDEIRRVAGDYMKAELFISNKESGKTFNCYTIAQEVTYTTERTGSPGTLKFSIIKGGDLSYAEGDAVRFSVGGVLIFYGWVFTKLKNRWGEIETTCYDRLRYLKASASYAFYGQTAGEIIAQIAADYQLGTGQLDNTGWPIPSLIEEEQTCLDIIGGVVNQTLLNTGRVYIFFDDGNGLALRESGKMISNVVIGEKSLLTEYDYKTDIDEQTYNSVKLARPNETTGRADIFEERDSYNIGQWGLLQLYQSIDADMNDAQAIERARATLKRYNRRMQTLSVSSLGVPGLRAGQMVLLKVPGLGDINLNQYSLLEKVTHTFKNEDHTMDFDTWIL